MIVEKHLEQISAQKGQIEKKGQSGSPIHNKHKGQQRHHPYQGGSSQGRSSGTGAQFRAMVKPGFGLVCFRCGDLHMQSECS
jgi:hypothetical protein